MSTGIYLPDNVLIVMRGLRALGYPVRIEQAESVPPLVILAMHGPDDLYFYGRASDCDEAYRMLMHLFRGIRGAA
jgi:hypothetical protein